jgi:hypothetical protein
MSPLVIYMDKGSLHVWQILNFVLQLLADIVCLPKRSVSIHHDIDFYKIILYMPKK